MKSQESNRPPMDEVLKLSEQLTEDLFFALKFKFQQLLAPYPQEQKRWTYNQAILLLLWQINCGAPERMGVSIRNKYQKFLNLEAQFMELCDEYHKNFGT